MSIEEKMEKAYPGWKDDNCSIDWKNISNDVLVKGQQEIITEGIKPLLKELLGDIHKELDERIEKSKSKIILLPEAQFIYCSYATDFNIEFDVATVVEDDNFNDFLKKIKSCKGDQNEEEFLKSIMEEYGPIQGQAMGIYQVINKDRALKNAGWHLICHEIMHCIANPDYVHEIRINSNFSMGDDPINEYFARLATLFLVENNIPNAGCPICKEIIQGDNYHSKEWGLYGKLMIDDNISSKTKISIKDIFQNVSKLKEIAKEYFK